MCISEMNAIGNQSHSRYLLSYLECIGSARGNSATVTCFDFENGFAVLPARQLLDEPFFNCMHHLVVVAH